MKAYQRKLGLKKPMGFIQGNLNEQNRQYKELEGHLPMTIFMGIEIGKASEMYEEMEN